MLVTELKSKDALQALEGKRIFIINCRGCGEAGFPETEAKALQKELSFNADVTGLLNAEYICNKDNLRINLESRQDELDEADAVLVFSCGVGVQTAADFFEGKSVYAACDTYRLPGNQGVTPLETDCRRCGECWLNLTGGICPITACSKSLLNGPCGGTKNGKCEVSPDMECGWERIFRRLEEQGRLDEMKCPALLRDYNVGK